MKLLKLIISDSAYSKALELAGNHSVPIEAYLASEVEDLLDKQTQIQNNQPLTSFHSTVNKTQPAISLRRAMTDTLEQVLAVCKYVYRTKAAPRDPEHARVEFLEAINIVAKNTVNSRTGVKGVETTTVRDKCTRLLGRIDTSTFVAWLNRPELLRDHLCRKFPVFVIEINQKFAEWLPGKFQNNQSHGTQN
jgi:hypothetical protein